MHRPRFPSSRVGAVKCYVARETPDALVNLCARGAASLGLSDEQLKTIPVELRERLNSFS